MTPDAYFRSLDGAQQRALAAHLDMNLKYLLGRVFPANASPTRCLRFSTQCQLADASGGLVGRHECWQYFAQHFAPTVNGVHFTPNKTSKRRRRRG